MRLEVERIKDREIEIGEDIEASAWELDSFDIKFIKNIHLNCKFVRVGKEILVGGKITIYRRATCSRCLEATEQVINKEFKLSYNVSSLGNYLDIDKDVREEILLDFPMKVLCKADCKGICPMCGANLNFEECQCQK